MCDERIKETKSSYRFYEVFSVEDLMHERIERYVKLKVMLEYRLTDDLIYASLEACKELGIDNTNGEYSEMFIEGYKFALNW